MLTGRFLFSIEITKENVDKEALIHFTPYINVKVTSRDPDY